MRGAWNKAARRANRAVRRAYVRHQGSHKRWSGWWWLVRALRQETTVCADAMRAGMGVYLLGPQPKPAPAPGLYHRRKATRAKTKEAT